jgi:hypothetical protein
MPILTETTPSRKGRAPVWLLIIALVVLPPMAVLGWSCYQPVTFVLDDHCFGFGYGTPSYRAYMSALNTAHYTSQGHRNYKVFFNYAYRIWWW